MPRTLFVTNLVTHYRLPLYRRMAEIMDIEFVAYSDGGEWYWQSDDAGLSDLPARRLRGRWLGRTRITPELARVVLRDNYDVCVAGLLGKFALPVNYLGARFRRKGFVLWTSLWRHPTTGLHRLTALPTRYLYRHADAIVTYGRHVSRHVIDQGADPSRVFEAPQAVDQNRFTSDGRQASNRTLRIGFVGRLETWKGPQLLIEALAKLSLANADFSARFAGDGELAVPCRRALEAHGLTERVQLCGHIPNAELPDFYRSIDVLVVPSLETAQFTEPWSLAVNEAMGCGALVIASSAVGAVADGLLTHGSTGLVFDQGDVEALTGLLLRVSQDPAMVITLQRAGELAVQAYSYEAAAQTFVQAVAVADRRRGRGQR